MVSTERAMSKPLACALLIAPDQSSTSSLFRRIDGSKDASATC